MIEPLESRLLLSSYGLSSTGVLTLTGNPTTTNSLYVDLNKTSGQLMVTCDGGSMNAPVSSVKQIVITGGNATDHVYINANITIPAVIKTFDGTDDIDSGSGDDSITVGNGSDYIMGRGGNDTIVAGNGHDSIWGGDGNDSITAGDGGDVVYGEQGNDTISTGSGNDSLYGGDGNDSMSGGAGNDYLEGDAGNDTLLGGDGNDTLIGNSGSDALDGGAGSNTYPDLTSADTAPVGTVASSTPQAATGSTLSTGGAVVNNDEVITGSNHGDALAPTPVINLIGVTGIGPHSIFVHAVDSQLGSGTVLTAKYQWNFGDPLGKYNTLPGWNASHIYDTPGTYTITLTITNQLGKTSTLTAQVTVTADTRRSIYVDNAGNDANNGATPATAVKTVDRAIALMGSAVRLLFHAGQTFNVDNPISITYHDVLIGSYGSGADPVLNRVSGVGTSIVVMYDNASQIVVQDLTLDSIWKPVGAIAEKMNADGIFPAGVNVAIRRMTFLNLDDGVDNAGNPVGTLVEDCSAPSATGIRGYFIWGQGSDQVYIGNSAANSTREHIVRTVGTVRQLIAYNNFTNLDRRPLGDTLDYSKGTLELHRGSYNYVVGNKFYDGELRTGPLGGATEPPNSGTDWTVVEGNYVNNYSMEVLPGTHHLMVRNNVFNITNDTDIAIVPSRDGLTSADLSFINNTGITNGTGGHFLYMYGGSPAGMVTLRNNLWVAPNAVGGNGASAVFIADTTMKGIAISANNVWQLPNTANPWGLGGVMYVYPQWGFQQGYLNPAKWAAQPNVTHDTFANVPLNSSLAPSSSSIAAGAGAAVPGVFNDLYGNLRPTSGSVSAGAVQVNGMASSPPPQTVPVSVPPTGSISGKFFLDANRDGIWNAGEAVAPYWWAYIDANNNGKYDSGERQVRADGTATYNFTGLAAGTYVVRSMVASGWTSTTSARVSLGTGQNLTGANIGEYHGTLASAPTGSISGKFFLDANHNGIWDSGEAPAPYWWVYIDANNNGKYDTGEREVRADSTATYLFSGLAAGTYIVRPMVASGWTPTKGAIQVVSLASGQNFTGANIGEYHGTVG